MCKVIQFPKTTAVVGEPADFESINFDENLDNINTSLAEINALLKELKATTEDWECTP